MCENITHGTEKMTGEHTHTHRKCVKGKLVGVALFLVTSSCLGVVSQHGLLYVVCVCVRMFPSCCDMLRCVLHYNKTHTHSGPSGSLLIYLRVF